MIARAYRFHGHSSVRLVYKKGSHIGGKLFAAKYFVRHNDRPYRVAIVVSRKVHKSAVVRNRIRRRLYEAIRTNPEMPPVNVDLVITVYSETLQDLAQAELQRLVHDLIAKIQLKLQ